MLLSRSVAGAGSGSLFASVPPLRRLGINQVYLPQGTSAMATKTTLYFDHVRALW